MKIQLSFCFRSSYVFISSVRMLGYLNDHRMQIYFSLIYDISDDNFRGQVRASLHPF